MGGSHDGRNRHEVLPHVRIREADDDNDGDFDGDEITDRWRRWRQWRLWR